VDAQVLAKVLETWLPLDDRTSPHNPPQPTRNHAAMAIAPSESSTARVFNRASFLTRVMNDEELLNTVCAAFLTDMPAQVAALTDLVSHRETRRAGEQAHKIKGAAANVGGEALRNVAAAMEIAGREGDQAKLEQLGLELPVQFQRLKQAMEG
jgi:HPt (histidine-containing phosphotransfer) domain-containing protein